MKVQLPSMNSSKHSQQTSKLPFFPCQMFFTSGTKTAATSEGAEHCCVCVCGAGYRIGSASLWGFSWLSEHLKGRLLFGGSSKWGGRLPLVFIASGRPLLHQSSALLQGGNPAPENHSERLHFLVNRSCASAVNTAASPSRTVIKCSCWDDSRALAGDLSGRLLRRCRQMLGVYVAGSRCFHGSFSSCADAVQTAKPSPPPPPSLSEPQPSFPACSCQVE